MAHAYYQRLSGDDVEGTYRADPSTAGPWSPSLQHGGPPSALAVTLADRVVHAQTGRSDLVPLRVAVDFLGPAPVDDVDLRVTVLRTARSAALAEVTLAAGGRDRMRSRVWFLRTADTTELATASTVPPPIPDGPNQAEQWNFGYGASLDWRYTSGMADQLGPAAVWVRASQPLVDDSSEMPGLARVVLVADSASGISATLDWSVWSFVNVDLDVHLARPFHGEWVHVDAATQLGPAGSALARSVISDPDGVVGAGLQTLVVAPAG